MSQAKWISMVAVRHRYQTLRPGVEIIRLARLSPRRADEEVQVDMLHLDSLTGSTEYEALLYVWESQASPRSIRIGLGAKHQRLVAMDLLEPLQYLRHGTQPRIHWVDAICINQADSAERNAQVAQTSLSYRHARRVIVRLGPDSDDHCCSAGIDTLQDIGTRFHHDAPPSLRRHHRALLSPSCQPVPHGLRELRRGPRYEAAGAPYGHQLLRRVLE